MKRILKRLIILIVILNFMGMMIQCIITNDNKATIVNSSLEKDRLQIIKEKGVITVASSIYDFPFFYINPETNEISGIDADIIKEIAKRLKIDKVEVKETAFSNLLNKLNTDDSIDIAGSGIYITPMRKELVAFTEPLYKESESVVVPQFSNINFMDDLKDAAIGVVKGTLYEELAQKWKDNNIVKNIVIYENTSNLLNDINSQKIDAGLTDSVVVNSYLSKDKKLILRTLQDYKPELIGNIGIAVKKNDTELLKELNKIINEMKEDGTIYSILVEYGAKKDNVI